MRGAVVLAPGVALSALLIPAAAFAQASPSAFTTGYRYDAGGRQTGVILPTPDGSTSNFPATRSTYDSNGNLVKVEKGMLAAWQDETILPANWTGFTVFQSVNTGYDAQGRKVRAAVADSLGTEHQVTQTSYDAYDRVICTAVRMHPSNFATLPSDACLLDAQGNSTSNPDRITQTNYDVFNRVTSVVHALNTPLAQTYVSYTYSGSFALVDMDKPVTVTDGNGNKTSMTYGGSVFSKITRMQFPSPTTAGQSSTTDYEEYGYDSRGNRTSLRKRDGRTIGYSYDALNRLTVKDITGACVSGYACTTPPTWSVRDVYYAYDLRGLQLSARFDSSSGSDAVVNAYDGFGHLASSTTSMGGTSRTVQYRWDQDGNKKRVIHPDSYYFVYGYDGLNRVYAAAISTGTQFLTILYDAQGRPSSVDRGSSTVTYGYDGISRLTSQAIAPSGGTGVTTATFAWNPAGQITTETRSNDAYAYTGSANLAQAYVPNGLNQYTSVGGVTLGYDSNGNLSSNGGTSFTYDVENRLVKAQGTLNTEMTYDPLGRLWQTTGSSTNQFLYDGDDLIAEYDGAGALLKRYAHGTGDDTPLLWVEGSGFTDVRTLLADARGSVVAVVQAGLPLAINAYDEYGVPKGGNLGRFQYTGQTYLPELGMYYYKARIYSSRLGRFLQTDPIGYEDQVNLYAYTRSDPVNAKDPNGKQVVSFYDSQSRILMVRDMDTGIIAVATDTKSGTERGGALPTGEYAILEYHKEGHEGWFRLEGIDSKFGDDEYKGRTELRLHEGSTSYGCVTMCNPTQGDTVNQVIGATSTKTQNVDSKSRNPLAHLFGENVKDYGRMFVDVRSLSITKSGTLQMTKIVDGKTVTTNVCKVLPSGICR